VDGATSREGFLVLLKGRRYLSHPAIDVKNASSPSTATSNDSQFHC